MKPFNLKEFRSGKPALTRSGSKAFFVGINPLILNQMSFVTEKFPGISFDCDLDGSYDGMNPTDLDLIGMAKVKRTVWVNLYQGSIDWSCWYKSQADADAAARNSGFDEHRVGNKAWPLEIEE